MATLEIKSASPFMNQEGELTKLTVILQEGTQMEDVLPFIGNGKKGIRLTNENSTVEESKIALLKDIREKAERLIDFVEAAGTEVAPKNDGSEG